MTGLRPVRPVRPIRALSLGAIAIAMLASTGALAQSAPGVPSAEELTQKQVNALAAQINALQQQNAFAQALLERVRADGEARESTLIEWLKEAQGNATKPTPPPQASVAPPAQPTAPGAPVPSAR